MVLGNQGPVPTLPSTSQVPDLLGQSLYLKLSRISEQIPCPKHTSIPAQTLGCYENSDRSEQNAAAMSGRGGGGWRGKEKIFFVLKHFV